MVATLTFERFVSLADEHMLYIRCRVTPEFEGRVEFRAGLNGNMHNEGLVHFQWLGQGKQDNVVYLHNRTRRSNIEIATAMRITDVIGREIASEVWDVENASTQMIRVEAAPGQTVGIDKHVAVFTSRESNQQMLLRWLCIAWE